MILYSLLFVGLLLLLEHWREDNQKFKSNFTVFICAVLGTKIILTIISCVHLFNVNPKDQRNPEYWKVKHLFELRKASIMVKLDEKKHMIR